MDLQRLRDMSCEDLERFLLDVNLKFVVGLHVKAFVGDVNHLYLIVVCDVNSVIPETNLIERFVLDEVFDLHGRHSCGLRICSYAEDNVEALILLL